MQRTRQGVALALLAWLLSGAALVRLAWLPELTTAGPVAALTHASPARTLPLLLALLVLGTGCWVAVTAGLTLLARVPGAAGRYAVLLLRRVSPAFLRRAVEAALGATVVLTAASGVAQASAGTHPVAVHLQTGTVEPRSLTATTVTLDRPAALDALPSLDRPTEPPSLDRPASSGQAALPTLDRPAGNPGRGLGLVTPVGPRTVTHQAHSVRVQVGDSLWRIAARSLPHGADDAQIERAWHRWYAANRAVIGADPGRLLPGQLLAPPQP